MTNSIRESSNGRAASAGSAAFVRLGWMVAGPIAMIVSIMGIAAQTAWTLGWRDIVFWSAVASSAAFRYLDVMRFAGETANGRPATRAVLGYYLVGLCIVATLAWYGAHSVHL
jgi:hypothetical protein